MQTKRVYIIRIKAGDILCENFATANRLYMKIKRPAAMLSVDAETGRTITCRTKRKTGR